MPWAGRLNQEVSLAAEQVLCKIFGSCFDVWLGVEMQLGMNEQVFDRFYSFERKRLRQFANVSSAAYLSSQIEIMRTSKCVRGYSWKVIVGVGRVRGIGPRS
jgi:hypothetical protein